MKKFNVIVSVFNDTYNRFPPFSSIKEKIRSQHNYFLQKGNIDFKTSYNEENKEWRVQTIVSLPLYKFIWCILLYYPLLFLELSQSQGFSKATQYLKNNFNKIKELNKEVKF